MKFKKIEPYKELTEKALAFYSETDPISILTDGEMFKISGAFERDCSTMGEVNAVLEALADEASDCIF